MTMPTMDSSQSLVCGRYRLLAVTAVLPVGTIHRGFDVMTEQPVFVTTLKKDRLRSAGARNGYTHQQIRLDTESVNKWTHPGVLNIYDQHEDQDSHYVVSEYTAYKPLMQTPPILAKGDAHVAMIVFDRIVTIVQYFHASGVFGCCARPESIYVSPTGDVRLDNLLQARLGLFADLPSLGSSLSDLAAPPSGAFKDMRANEQIDIRLAGSILKSLLSLAGKVEAASVATDGRAEADRAIRPLIEAIAGKLGDSGSRAYATIADLAQDVREAANRIKAMRSPGSGAQLTASASRRDYLPGEIIFKEGDDARDEAYIIENGSVQILKDGPDGREIYLDVSKAGDILGEMGLIDDQPRMATARVIEPCTVAVITGSQFKSIMDKAGPVPRRLINVMVGRLRYQSGEITRLKSLLGATK